MPKKEAPEMNQKCAFCEYAEKLNDEDKMLCPKYGVVFSGFHCRKFIYDPLKRTPTPPPPLPTLSEEDKI